MTHLATDIRVFALDVLEWLLAVAGDEVVGSAGGWVKTLKCFLGLLGWQTGTTAGWSAPRSAAKAGGEAKVQVKQMNALASFLRTGLVPSQSTASTPIQNFPLWDTAHHVLPQYSNAYAHLNLCGAVRDEEAEMYEDREDRQRVFHSKAEAAVVAGIEQSIKGGGELGRAAAQLRKVLKEGMADFHGDQANI